MTACEGPAPPQRVGGRRARVKLSGQTWVTAEPRCVQAAQKQKMPSGLCTHTLSAPTVRPRYEAALRPRGGLCGSPRALDIGRAGRDAAGLQRVGRSGERVATLSAGAGRRQEQVSRGGCRVAGRRTPAPGTPGPAGGGSTRSRARTGRASHLQSSTRVDWRQEGPPSCSLLSVDLGTAPLYMIRPVHKAQTASRALQHHRQPRQSLLVFCGYGHKRGEFVRVQGLCGQPEHLGPGAQCHQGVWCHAPHRAPGGRKTSCALVGRSRSRLTAACTPAGAAGAATACSSTPMAAGSARPPARTRPGLSHAVWQATAKQRFGGGSKSH